MATVRNGPMPCLLPFHVDLSISNWNQHAEQQALKAATKYYPHQLQQMASKSCKFSKSMQCIANLCRTEILSLKRTHPFLLQFSEGVMGVPLVLYRISLLSAHDFTFSRESSQAFVRSLSSRALCFLLPLFCKYVACSLTTFFAALPASSTGPVVSGAACDAKPRSQLSRSRTSDEIWSRPVMTPEQQGNRNTKISSRVQAT